MRTVDLLRVKGGQIVLTHFSCIPQFLRHDTKLGSLGAYPVAFGVEAVCEAPGVGVLELLLPVPADDADIKLTVQDAGTDDAVAPDGGIVPALSRGAWDALAVQVGSDVPRPFAGDIFAEDASHDFGLLPDDLAFAPDRLAVCVEPVNDAVAVGVAPADLSGLDAAPDAAMGLDGEVLEKQGVHRALQADMKLVDLAFRQGEDAYVCKTQSLEHASHVLLIAADTVQRFRQHHVKEACLRIGEKRLDTRTDQRCAGDGAV